LTPYRIEGAHCAPDLPLIEPLGPEILHAFGFSSSARTLAADTVALAALCCAYSALAFAALLASTRFHGVKHISSTTATTSATAAAAANGSNSGSGSSGRFQRLWQQLQQRLHFWPFQQEQLQEQPLPPPTPLVISAQVLSPRSDSRSATAAAAAATAPLLTFSQLSYSILTSKRERRVILDGVSGFAGPTTSASSSGSKRSTGFGSSSSSSAAGGSNLVGLMGSSGAGETTL
jgi:hypothetical protein